MQKSSSNYNLNVRGDYSPNALIMLFDEDSDLIASLQAGPCEFQLTRRLADADRIG